MSTKTAYLYLLYTLIYSLTFAYVLLVTNYTPYTTRTNNLYIYIYQYIYPTKRIPICNQC